VVESPGAVEVHVWCSEGIWCSGEIWQCGKIQRGGEIWCGGEIWHAGEIQRGGEIWRRNNRPCGRSESAKASPAVADAGTTIKKICGKGRTPVVARKIVESSMAMATAHRAYDCVEEP
jgi:hypothetical protein